MEQGIVAVSPPPQPPSSPSQPVDKGTSSGGSGAGGGGSAAAARPPPAATIRVAGWYVQDMQTANGTKLNGVKLDPSQYYLLKEDSTLELGLSKGKGGYVGQFVWNITHQALPAALARVAASAMLTETANGNAGEEWHCSLVDHYGNPFRLSKPSTAIGRALDAHLRILLKPDSLRVVSSKHANIQCIAKCAGVAAGGGASSGGAAGSAFSFGPIVYEHLLSDCGSMNGTFVNRCG